MENNVRELRLNKGWSITDLAREARLSTKTISKMEKGDKTSEVSRRKVVNALQVEYKKAFPKNEDKKRANEQNFA